MPFFGHLNIIAIIAINRFLISRFLKCVNMKVLKKTHLLYWIRKKFSMIFFFK